MYPFAGGPDDVINDVILGSKSKMTSSIPGKGRGNSRRGNSRKRVGWGVDKGIKGYRQFQERGGVLTRQKDQRIPTITGKGWGRVSDKGVKGHRQFQESGGG